MAALIDIVGHFGTTFSYAAVASEVARGLREIDRLGTVMNLDAEWHDSFSDLHSRSRSGRHVILFTAPHHYIDAYVAQYGSENSALYMSPNTDRLAEEHAITCGKFGKVFAPSRWCERVTRMYVPGVDIDVVPLGVSSSYAEGREDRMAKLRRRALHGTTCQVLHMSTDQSWPGRKGTEELIEAWCIIEPLIVDKARLTLHVPPSIQREAEYLIREHGVDRTVTVSTGDLKGTESIEDVVKSADLIVAPSRCEGFGMMFLASLVAGVPLVCTYNTGHRDFLKHMPGWLGLPTDEDGPMEREDGLVPVINPGVLAGALVVAVQPESRIQMSLCNENGMASPQWGTWEQALPEWMERLVEWTEGS